MSIGRFEVKRVLGRGAQSCVYLAHDPDLQREVAIKRLSRPGAGVAVALPQTEARAVSRLRHPNIVPIFEWGQQDGQAHLVFEYVAGRTLADLIAQDGALPPAKAVALMIGVLEALEQAHAAGIVHHDLKPSNILIDESGRPRVTDFGLAAESHTIVGGSALQGTAAYMAPEYIGRGEVTPKYDLFAAGLVLYEAVFGKRAVGGENAFQAMHQIANMPLVFPEGSTADVDPRLHEIIVKATVKDPDLRYATAQQMREALQAWARAPADIAAESNEAARQSTLDFLLRRLRLKTDFPAMSSSIQAIQRLTSSDKTHVANLSNFILKDFALTNKILRLVNSASYPNRSGDRIRTVSRAIVILGFDTVRSIAISLMLFEHIRDRKHAQALRDEFLRVNLGALLARDLGAKLLPTQTEETFICGLFHDLGRLLTHYYLRDEAEAIVRLAQTERCAEEAVASRVLGLGYDELGIGVAKSWGFADSIVNAMRRQSDDPPVRPTSADEQLRLLCALSTEVRGVLETTSEAGRAGALAVLAKRYGKCLPLLEKDLIDAVRTAVNATADLAATLGIDWAKSQIGQALGGAVPGAPCASASLTTDSGAERIGPTPVAAAVDGEACLSAGIQEVSQALVEDLPVQDILRIVVETIYRATDARRAFLCLREPSQPKLRARIAFGSGAEEAAPAFIVELGGNDLFNRILSKDAGVLIADAGEERVRAHLPAWFTRRIDAKTFLVFPLKAKGVPIGMLYVDHDRPNGLSVSESGLAQLHTLRNQTLLVLRQKR